MLGIDVGSRRVGVAAADEETRFARPVEVIDVERQDPIERIAQLVTEMGASIVVVGKPIGLSGAEGPAVKVQADFVTRLRAALGVAVEEFDERLTTVLANRALRASGVRPTDRKRLRDAIAAQVMLQGYLDSTR
ncbi:MAG: Holliday junction resolvase RuvX [Actinomycetota bacterium]|nr:Holliday junction resolvase RuvX [Actinomycetota bacterium]